MYEYKILITDEPTASEEQLAEYGEERWGLLFILPWQGKFYYYFSRDKINNTH